MSLHAEGVHADYEERGNERMGTDGYLPFCIAWQNRAEQCLAASLGCSSAR